MSTAQKYISSIVVALALLTFASAHIVAQVGAWRSHTTFDTNNLQRIIALQDRVYYLLGGSLYCYHIETQENEALTKQNALSDNNVQDIYYSNTGHYLIVVYTNSNIDILTDSGHTYNLPDIKQANIQSSRSINNISTHQGGFCIATDFGYVIYEDKKFTVEQSIILNKKVTSVAYMGNRILISTNGHIYHGEKDKRYNNLSQMDSVSSDNPVIVPINDHLALAYTGWFFKLHMNDNGYFWFEDIAQRKPAYVQSAGTAAIACFTGQNGSSEFMLFDQQGNITTQSHAQNMLFASADGTNLWALGTKGICTTDIQGNPTSEYIRPTAISFAPAFYLNVNPHSNQVYLSGTGTNRFWEEQTTPAGINIYKQGVWTDITPADLGSANYNTVFSPTKSDYFLTYTWWDGIKRISTENGKITNTYNYTNSPMIHALNNYYCYAIPAFDSKGNLWAVEADNIEKSFVLPAEKINSGATVQKSDWLTYSTPGKVSKSSTFIITRKNIKILAEGGWEEAIHFWKETGDALNGSTTFKTVTLSQFTDQDGKIITWKALPALVLDQNDLLWIGTSDGVVTLDPNKVLNNDVRVNHIKVPRNDGTQLADYLLGNQQVNCIAIDGANRKWIGSDNQGLYLVSPDGTQILEHFTTSNSPLLSDRIYSIACDPTSNSVFISTPGGVQEYFSDAAPGESQYTEIGVTPNPVTPQFTGNITITKLVEGSLIHITDAQGNVVRTLKSNGGLATWDGNNEQGTPVSSGVYYIHASAGGSGAVGKLLIIR